MNSDPSTLGNKTLLVTRASLLVTSSKQLLVTRTLLVAKANPVPTHLARPDSSSALQLGAVSAGLPLRMRGERTRARSACGTARSPFLMA